MGADRSAEWSTHTGALHRFFTIGAEAPGMRHPSPFLPLSVLAAIAAGTLLAATNARAEPPSDLRPKELPAFVSDAKRMSAADVAKKRSGFYATGLPFFSADPLNGFGGGLSALLFYNGKADDPFFAYTAYRAKWGVKLEYSTGSAAAVSLKMDVPYVANTAWRLKVDGKFESTPNNLYFGLTEDTLRPLPGGRYSRYADRLASVRDGAPGEAPRVADPLKHYFLEREWMLNLKGERALGGNWRLLAGYELQKLSYRTFDGDVVPATDPATGGTVDVPNGTSLLRADAAAGRAFGLGGGRASLLQLSLMYDTRDFEPDPYRGIFLEFGQEHSARYTGSAFTFHKMLLQGRGYVPLFPSHLKRTLLAVRGGLGTILGDRAPFFEFQDQWSAEGSIRALGGSQTLRGFKANRFLGRTVAFANLELRHRFADFDVAGQNITLTAAPFFDAGTVGDRPFLLAPTVRAAGGLGLRIGWNRSTVIVADAAFSQEDSQFFLNFNQSY